MLYKGDICNIMLLIALIMLRSRTLENGRFSPPLAYSFVLLLQKPLLAAKPQSFAPMNFFLQYDAPPFNNPDLDKDARSGIIAMPQTEMNQVPECPESGYTYHWATANLGSVYCVRTRDGEHYAIIKLMSIGNNSLSFTWEYQPDGSRRFH